MHVTPSSQHEQLDLFSLDHWLQWEPHRAALLSRSGQQGIPLPKHCLRTDSLVDIVQLALGLHLLGDCSCGLLML